MPGKKPRALERTVRGISSILMYVSMGMLLIMMLLGTADVLGRYFIDKPILGTYEIFEILMPGIIFFGLAYTQLLKGHITIEFVYSRLPPRLRAGVSFVTSLVLLCLFGLIIWRGIITAIDYWQLGRIISNIKVPIFPFLFFLPLGALTICLVLILQVLEFLSEMRKVD